MNAVRYGRGLTAVIWDGVEWLSLQSDMVAALLLQDSCVSEYAVHGHGAQLGNLEQYWIRKT